MAHDSSTTSSSASTGSWRRVIDPPDRGEVVWVKDEHVPGWEEPASLVSTGHDIWVSELSGHIVYPTHWKAIE